MAVDRSDGTVRCRVEDDGAGFPAEQDVDSFGLSAMRDRAERLGGAFTVHSRPGEGTRLEASLPLS